MTKRRSYTPRHRDPQPGPGARVARASGAAVRHGLVLSSMAAAATGTVVTGGVLLGDAAAADAPRLVASASGAEVIAKAAEATAAAWEVTAGSRSDHRADTDPVKAAALTASTGKAEVRTEDLSEGDPRVIARLLLPEYGFSDDQFSCLDSLYVSESGWQIDADNPTSSAYGIPQALTRLHDLPPGYMTSAEVQIRWGLEYIQSSYGTPCGAWAFKQSHDWY